MVFQKQNYRISWLNRLYPPRRAFTLIELLVVIVIVAILAAIVLPTFAQVREKAHMATCQSNLREMGMAFAQYTQDFEETYPCNTADTQFWQGTHFRWAIMPYLGINQQRVAGTQNANTPYAQILTCPSDSSMAYNGTSYFYSFAFTIDTTQLSTITGWGDIFSKPLVPVPQSVSAVTTPAQKILAGEWADNHDKAYSPPRGWYPPLPAGVETWRVYLFADGHVKYLPNSRIAVGYDGIPDPNETMGGVGGRDVP